MKNKNIKNKSILKKTAALFILLQAATVGSASAALKSLGPVNASYGYPNWYQDLSGYTLDLCVPETQAELDAGICLILPANVPSGTVPELFPSNFSVEHFYAGASSTLATNSSLAGVRGGSATLFLSLEASFINGKPKAGDQVVFSRTRIRIKNLPSDGNYRVINPYGVVEFPNMKAGEAINYTDDFGVNCGIGRFDCVLNSSMGSFLRPINPDGTQKAPIALGAGLYISDGVALERVQGGPFGNKFRVEGPNIGGPGIDFIETDLFTLNGKIHTAPIPSPLKILSASYSRSVAAGAKVDVFAEANAGNRLSMILNAVDPALGAPVSTGSLMNSDGNTSYQHGQVILANPASLPESVTVFNNTDNPISFISTNLNDKVTVSVANYDPKTNTLTVNAKSSDEYNVPLLSVYVNGLVSPLVGGAATIANVVVPPSEITVISSAGGKETVAVNVGQVAPPSAVLANDSGSTLEDTSVTIPIGANDTGVAAGSYAIAVSPVNGTVVINQNLVAVPSLTTVTYTPKANFNGVDKFSYVAVGLDGAKTTLADVTVTVTPVNDPPTALADGACSLLGKSLSLNVMANDFDVDGNLVAGSASIIASGAGNLGSAVMANGILSYTAPLSLPLGVASAVDTFDYQIVDSAGEVSAPARVSIYLYSSEAITVTSAIYTTKQLKWVVTGTSSILNPACGNIVTAVSGSTLSGAVIGSAAVDTLGNWAIQFVPSSVPVSSTKNYKRKESPWWKSSGCSCGD